MKKTLSIAIFMIIGIACDTEYFNPIPDARVLLNLHLDTNVYDRVLLSIGNSQIYDKNSRTYDAVERIGYGGIIVYHGTENGIDKYYAYDLACPNEATPTVKVAKENLLYARCPKCKTKFDISSGFGNPVEGTAKYPLKRYNNVRIDGYIVTIYN